MFGDNIWKATARGDLEKVRDFVARDGISTDLDEYDSHFVLTFACRAGHPEIVRYLLQNGAYWGNYSDYSPQAFVALDNNHIHVLRVLLEFGLNSRVLNGKHGNSLLSTAVDNKQREAVELFMEYGADIEESYWCPEQGGFGYDRYVATEDDPPVIEIATYAGRVDMVEFFLAVGADLDGQSAESYLQRARENELLRLDFEVSQNPKPKSNSKPKVNTDGKLDIQSVLCLILVWAVIFAVLNWVSNIFYAWRKWELDVCR